MKLKRRLAFFSVMLVISVFLVSVSSCKGDGLEVDENGNVIDNSWMEEIPTGKTILAFDISGKYSVAIDGGDPTQVKDWTSVNVYTYTPELFGSWPGLPLNKKVSGNPNIFYAEVPDGRVGSATFLFNDGSSKVTDTPLTIAAGKRYIFRSGNLKEF